jgi:DNA/RNA endonuclease G (NUC1)
MPDRGHICFDAYISAFEDTLPENGRPLGIPIWVSYEIDRGKPAETSQPRPSRWYTVQPLVERKIAPTDASYATTITFRRANSNWYERGHLAPKFLAERLGEAAARFTHNVVNAVPQRGRFNRGPWFELECKTGAWANEYGAVWVIAGPIFLNGHPAAWLAPDGAMPVAIPDGLFKVVARKVSIGGGDQYEILAFIYPQDSPLYEEQHWDDINWRTTVKRIEEVTGLRLVNAGVTYTDAPTNGPWPQHRKDFDPGCARFAPGSDSDATATR